MRLIAWALVGGLLLAASACALDPTPVSTAGRPDITAAAPQPRTSTDWSDTDQVADVEPAMVDLPDHWVAQRDGASGVRFVTPGAATLHRDSALRVEGRTHEQSWCLGAQLLVSVVIDEGGPRPADLASYAARLPRTFADIAKSTRTSGVRTGTAGGHAWREEQITIVSTAGPTIVWLAHFVADGRRVIGAYTLLRGAEPGALLASATPIQRRLVAGLRLS